MANKFLDNLGYRPAERQVEGASHQSAGRQRNRLTDGVSLLATVASALAVAIQAIQEMAFNNRRSLSVLTDRWFLIAVIGLIIGAVGVLTWIAVFRSSRERRTLIDTVAGIYLRHLSETRLNPKVQV